MIFLYVVIREKILRSLMFNYKDQKWVGREEKKQPWAIALTKVCAMFPSMC